MNALTSHMPVQFTPDSNNSRALRNAFGKFATGVTIVTCASDEGPIWIAANSFSSLSLDPALLMWALDRKSRRFPYFQAARHFAIHVLASDQGNLCDLAAKDAHALDNVAHQVNQFGVPTLDGCLARFECALSACHDAGDHVIVVGQVDQVEMRDGNALTFFAGGFGKVQRG